MGFFEQKIKLKEKNAAISYYDVGHDVAPVIIFIHGFPFHKSMWDLQLSALKDKYRIIAYDVRGHGDSDAGEKEFSIELFANDLIFIMDELKIAKATVCGLSMGGYIVLNAAINHPGRFDSLILCDTTCTADSPKILDKRMKSIESIRKYGVEKYADESLKNLFAVESFTSREAEIRVVRKMIINTSEQTICNTLTALANRKDTCGKLSAIQIPVMLMVGKYDEITPPDASRFMMEQINGSIINIIEHAGHISNVENSFEFNFHLKKFITSVYKKELIKEELV